VPILPGDSLDQLFENVFPACGRKYQLTPTHGNLDLGALAEPQLFDEWFREANR